MTKSQNGLFVLLLSIGVSTLAHGQSNVSGIVSQRYYARSFDQQLELNFRRAGAAILGMGGAATATVQSSAAMVWNPAGLASIAGPTLSLDNNLNLNNREVFVQPLSGLKVVSQVEPRILPAMASAVYPVMLGRQRIAFGVNYHRMSPPAQKVTDTFYIYPAGTLDEIETPTGSLYAFVPGVAWEIMPQLAIGASYHFVNGASKYKLELKSPFLDEFVFYGFQDEESYSGSFAMLGVQIKPASWLALGATVTPSWQFEITEKQETELVATNTTGTTSATVATHTPPEDLDQFKLEIPLFYGVGLALRPMSRVTFAVDYENRAWSEAKQSTNGNPVATGLLNSNVVRAGVEYLASAKWADFPLRFGYYTEPRPYKDRYFQGQYFGEQIKVKALTFGAGVRRAAWTFDAAVELGSSDAAWWLDAGDYYNERVSSTEERFNEITFSFGYQF